MHALPLALLALLGCPKPPPPPPPAWSHDFPAVDRQPFAAFALGDQAVVVAPGTDAAPRHLGVGHDGAVLWEAATGCPEPGARPRVWVAGDRVLCALERSVSAVAADGSTWKWDAPGRLWAMIPAGDGLVVDVDHRSLVVLDLATGQPLRTLDVAGQLLDAGDTAGGPIAAVIRSGVEGGSPTLEGFDVGPGADGGARWSVPYSDLGTSSVVSGGVLLVQVFVTTTAYDLATGRTLYDHAAFWPGKSFTEGRLLVWGPREDGASVVFALDPTTHAVQWELAWPFDGAPLGAVEEAERVLVVGEAGTLVVAAADGAVVGAGPGVSRDQRLRALAPLGGSLLVASGNPDVTAQAVPLTPPPALPPVVPDGATWLVPGVRLVYVTSTGGGSGREQSDPLIVVVDTVEPLAWHLESEDGQRLERPDVVERLALPAVDAPSRAWVVLWGEDRKTMVTPAWQTPGGDRVWLRHAPFAAKVTGPEGTIQLVKITAP